MATTTDTSPIFISSMSTLCMGGYALGDGGQGGALASNAAQAANTAWLYPLYLPYTYNVQRVFCMNGNAPGGNIDVGVYNSSFTLQCHGGSTAQAGASVPQYMAATATLSPGQYYLAIVFSSVAGGTYSFSTVPGVSGLRMGGVLAVSSAPPLPGTASPVATTANYLPLFGITRTASGF